MTHPPPATRARLAELEALIDAWLAEQLETNPAVASVERVDGARRWYVRLLGEQKETFSALFTLEQRTLQYETYLMPAPVENAGELYEHLLRRNLRLYGLAVAIGAEDGVFLVGQLDVRAIDVDELDRVLGSLYLSTEQFFRPAMRIGYASRFKG